MVALQSAELIQRFPTPLAVLESEFSDLIAREREVVVLNDVIREETYVRNHENVLIKPPIGQWKGLTPRQAAEALEGFSGECLERLLLIRDTLAGEGYQHTETFLRLEELPKDWGELGFLLYERPIGTYELVGRLGRKEEKLDEFPAVDAVSVSFRPYAYGFPMETMGSVTRYLERRSQGRKAEGI